MNTLMIIAHPAPESLCQALAAAAIEGLGGSANPALRVIDLYQDYRQGFDPILGFGSLDGRRRRDMKDEDDMEPYRQAVRWAEHLVLVHPLWWGRAPALMEGWIDRLLASGFGFTYRGNSRIPTPLLRGKRATVVFSADAGPLVDRFYYRRQYQTRMGRYVLGLCGFAKVRFLPVYAVKYRKADSLGRELKRVRSHFTNLTAASTKP